MESQGGGIAHPRRVGRLSGAVGLETLDGRLDLGLDADIAGRADTDEQRAGLGIDGEVAVGVALDDAEDALLRDHVLAHHVRRRHALVRRHVGGALLGVAARAQGAHPVRHAPDPVLVDDEHIGVAPGETVGSVEAFRVALDPVGLAVAVLVAQQGEIAGPLLGDDDVAVGQDEKPPGIRQSGREGRRGKALGHAQRLAGIGNGERSAGDDRAGVRRRQVFRLDREVTADLLVGQRRRIGDRRLLRLLRWAGREARSISVRPGWRTTGPPQSPRHGGKGNASSQAPLI